MIIFIIHFEGISFFQLKGYTPVTTDLYGPGSFALTFELMNVQTRQIHVIQGFGGLKQCEDLPYARYMLRVDTFAVAGFKQLF